MSGVGGGGGGVLEDEEEVEGIVRGAQQKVKRRGIRTTCQRLIYYKVVMFDSHSLQLPQGCVKLGHLSPHFYGPQTRIEIFYVITWTSVRGN